MAKFDCERQESQTRGWSREGRVALVTGALGGLGKAIMTELRERGAAVHGADIVGEGVFRADLSTASGNWDVIGQTCDRRTSRS